MKVGGETGEYYLLQWDGKQTLVEYSSYSYHILSTLERPTEHQMRRRQPVITTHLPASSIPSHCNEFEMVIMSRIIAGSLILLPFIKWWEELEQVRSRTAIF